MTQHAMYSRPPALQVEALAHSAALAGTSASARLGETFRKLLREHAVTSETPAAPPGVEQPPFGP